MERVVFVSKKAAERFLRDARASWEVEQAGATVVHRGNKPGFTKYAKAYLANRRTSATVSV